ncbi:MAG: hypothetical protein ACLVGL_02350 [Waltera sp.]
MRFLDEEKTEKRASWYNDSKLLKQWSEKDRYVIMATAEMDKNKKDIIRNI